MTQMPDPETAQELEGVRIRLLLPSEGALLGDVVRAAYGDSYNFPWVYDAAEVSRRLAQGRMLSCIAESDRYGLLCHVALTMHSSRDRLGHAGQAVTMPAARGHHLFTAVKRHLASVAAERGLVGIYSEATAAHPYSQRANVELGAHETGFLLGYIPRTVSNDAAPATANGASGQKRQSVALFFLRTNHGPVQPVYAPARHRQMVHRTITTAGLHARLDDPPARARLSSRSTVHSHADLDQNMAVLTVRDPGADLAEVVGGARDRHFAHGVDAVYVDLPLDHHGSALVADRLEGLGLSYAGLFPTPDATTDVLRLQCLNGVRITASDVAVASPYGRELLDYVLDDLAAAGHDVERGADTRPEELVRRADP